MNSVVKCRLVEFCSVHMAAIWFNCTRFPPLAVLLSSFLWRPSGNGVFSIKSHSLCSWVQDSSHSVKIYSTPELPPQQNKSLSQKPGLSSAQIKLEECLNTNFSPKCCLCQSFSRSDQTTFTHRHGSQMLQHKLPTNIANFPTQTLFFS